MFSITSATLSWFDDGCCDVKYLDQWQDAPLSFTPGHVTDSNWYTDSYEKIIIPEAGPPLFQQAADLLFCYQLYSDQVLSFTSDFDQEQRPLRAGDRIVQRAHILHLFGRSILDIITMIEVTGLINEPRRAGISCVTTALHLVQGCWQIMLNWPETGELVVTMKGLSRPSPTEPARHHRFIRSFQRKMQQHGLNHFTRRVLTAHRPA
jgi:hypothetical protein